MKTMKHSVCRVVEPADALSLNLNLESLNMATTDVLNTGYDRQAGGAYLSGVR